MSLRPPGVACHPKHAPRTASRHQWLALVLVFTMIGGFFAGSSAASADPAQPAIVRDGSSPDRAAVSCWAIKQQNPAAQDGSYWLLTPAMSAPVEAYCDQTYDGGGWVLIAKGREGWQDNYNGEGNASALRSVDRSPAGFGTVQLSGPAIDGLMNNTRLDSLDEGVRILRAADAQGSTWQNVHMRLADRDRWTWALDAGLRMSGYNFGDGWRSGGSTASFGYDQAAGQVTFGFDSANGWTAGFAYGTAFRGGSTSNTSFLYSKRSDGSSPRPYAEVYLRPKLTEENVGWKAIDDAGSPEIAQRSLPSSYALANTWGVVGNFNGRRSEGNAPVQAFAEIGNTIFVGGNFAKVQRGSAGESVAQPALAAFDRSTGEFLRDFAPTFNGQVKALLALPNGKLLAGGEFTQVNGQNAVGTVLLDPATGQIDPSWNLQIQNRINGGVTRVRSMDLQGDYIYIGGNFTHLTGGPNAKRSYGRNAARVTWNNSTPDNSWNPEFNGGVMDLDAAADGTRVYIGGFFSRSKQVHVNISAAVVQSAAGAEPVDPNWAPTWSYASKSYIQTAVDAGDRFYFGGSEHLLFGYDAATLTRQSGSITRAGGDFQASAFNGQSMVVAGCHCNNFNYQDAYSWPNPGDTWTQADSIKWLGAWDAASGDYLPAFNPVRLRSSNGGLWGVFVASDGTVWAGGDFTGAATAPGRSTWAGGFVRFPLNDSSAPAAPSNLALTGIDESKVKLSWQASAESGVSYEILRDDRVIATTTDTSLEVSRGGNDRFFVRAADTAGNRSASTPVLANLQAPEASLIAWGQEWRYRYESQAPDSNWAASNYDDSAWNTGTAPLGFGHNSIVTNIDKANPSERPAVAYFRNSFTITDLAATSGVRLSLLADDGAVVYLNGVEISRTRVSPGTLNHTIYANQTIRTSAALKAPVVIEVPAELLVQGTNVITVSTHLGYRRTRDASFDLLAERIAKPVEDQPLEAVAIPDAEDAQEPADQVAPAGDSEQISDSEPAAEPAPALNPLPDAVANPQEEG